MTMRPKEGGFAVPARGTRELIPGGDHLMLMDLKEPLQPGDDVSLTVVFEDGSTLPVTAQIRDFPGANEEYTPGGTGSGGGHH
jgi:copper(I)-binding protein